MPFGNSMDVPEKQMKIAQRFNAGMYATGDKVPKGRPKDGNNRFTFRPSLRDSNSIDNNPGVETPGYYRDVPPGHISIEFPKGIRLNPGLQLRQFAAARI